MNTEQADEVAQGIHVYLTMCHTGGVVLLPTDGTRNNAVHAYGVGNFSANTAAQVLAILGGAADLAETMGNQALAFGLLEQAKDILQQLKDASSE